MHLGEIQQSKPADIYIGPFWTDAARDTLATSLSIDTSLDIKLAKSQTTTLVVPTATGTLPVKGQGLYLLSLVAADTNQAGPLRIIAAPGSAMQEAFTVNILTKVAYFKKYVDYCDGGLVEVLEKVSTVVSPTELILEDTAPSGYDDTDSLNGSIVRINQAGESAPWFGEVETWEGSTQTLTLKSEPPFTVNTSHYVTIFGPQSGTQRSITIDV